MNTVAHDIEKTERETGGLLARGFALFVDWAFGMVVAVFIMMIGGIFIIISSKNPADGSEFILPWLVAYPICWFLLVLSKDWIWPGQGLGKRFTGLVCCTKSNMPITRLHCVVRGLTKLFSWILGLVLVAFIVYELLKHAGLSMHEQYIIRLLLAPVVCFSALFFDGISIPFNKGRRGISDLLSGTRVLKKRLIEKNPLGHCAVILVCIFSESVFAGEVSPIYQPHQFPPGFSIQLPSLWIPLDEKTNLFIDTNAEEVAKHHMHYKGTRARRVIYRANTQLSDTYAAISIESKPNPFSSQELAGYSDEDLQNISEILRDGTIQTLNWHNIKLLEFSSAKKLLIDGIPAIKFGYRREGTKGVLQVRVLSFIVKDKNVLITLSYREKDETIWVPIISHVEGSIRISKM
jgi:uncharacterized RDD family membrane protein YckC